nr:transposase [Longirhabdus pacifica]
MRRKSHDKDFKIEAVRMVENGRKVAEVARELELADQTLHNSVQKYRKEPKSAFVGSGNRTPEDKADLN